MDFIFNELFLVDKQIDEHKVDDSNAVAMIRMLAKYNCHEKHMNKDENYKAILDYMTKYCKTFTEADYYKIIDNCIASVGKYGFKKIDSIKIMRSELSLIARLKNLRLERLAFVLLCVAKYDHYYSDSDEYWCNRSWTSIFSMARISKNSPEERQKVLRALKLAGAIETTHKVGQDSLKILFVAPEDDNNVVFELTETDFKELGYVYLYYKNGFDGFIPCQSCGRLIKKNTSNTKYSKECSKNNDSYNKDEFYENWKRQNGLESLKTQI